MNKKILLFSKNKLYKNDLINNNSIKKKVNNQKNIILAIRSFNRPNYLLNTINKIKKADINLCNNVIIYDDGSKNIRTLSILKNSNLLKCSDNKIIKVIFNKNNVGCYQSYLNLLDYIKINYSNNDYVIIVDNDVDVVPTFISNLFSIYQECEKNLNSKNIILSGFKPTNSHLEQNGKIFKNFHIRYSVGALCYIFNFNFIETLKNGWKGYKGNLEDWGIQKLISDKENYYFCCVNKSVVNHIGKIGLHSNSEKYDTDKNFKIN